MNNTNTIITVLAIIALLLLNFGGKIFTEESMDGLISNSKEENIAENIKMYKEEYCKRVEMKASHLSLDGVGSKDQSDRLYEIKKCLEKCKRYDSKVKTCKEFINHVELREYHQVVNLKKLGFQKFHFDSSTIKSMMSVNEIKDIDNLEDPYGTYN